MRNEEFSHTTIMAVSLWLFLLLEVFLVQADYLFELDLQRYCNPGGKNFNDRCCESQGTDPNGNCLTIDTCDPQFHIRLQNFNTQSFIGQDYVLGTFSNADSITFGNCQQISSTMSSNGIPNPLNFTFLTSEFTPMNTLRVTMDISHIEGRQSNIIVQNFVQQLDNIPGTNSSFSANMTFYATAPSMLTVQFRYRLICTAGSCGNNCSQTTGCPRFPQTCVPDCNQTTPCLNGGSCQDGNCLCTSTYEGSLCESNISKDTSAHLTTATPTHLTTAKPTYLITTAKPTYLTTVTPTRLTTVTPTHLTTDTPTHLTTDTPTTHLTTDTPTTHLTTDTPTHFTTDTPTHLTIDTPTHLTIDTPTHLTTDTPESQGVSQSGQPVNTVLATIRTATTSLLSSLTGSTVPSQDTPTTLKDVSTVRPTHRTFTMTRTQHTSNGLVTSTTMTTNSQSESTTKSGSRTSHKQDGQNEGQTNTTTQASTASFSNLPTSSINSRIIIVIVIILTSFIIICSILVLVMILYLTCHKKKAGKIAGKQKNTDLIPLQDISSEMEPRKMQKLEKITVVVEMAMDGSMKDAQAKVDIDKITDSEEGTIVCNSSTELEKDSQFTGQNNTMIKAAVDVGSSNTDDVIEEELVDMHALVDKNAKKNGKGKKQENFTNMYTVADEDRETNKQLDQDAAKI